MTDTQVRLAAFAFLAEQKRCLGDVLPRRILERGFEFNGQRIPLVGPQGIFRPRVLVEQIPLSITTAPHGPYDDGLTEEDLILYRYRGHDPQHHENVGLRRAMKQRTPLVYFRGLVEGRYLAEFPVFVVGDDPSHLTFRVQVSESLPPSDSDQVAEDSSEFERAYSTRLAKQRIHQRSFRERVIRVYRGECSLCRLKHEELLDAAHIIPDSDPRGLPEIPNGIAMCKLHHAAFDRRMLGIRPDHVVEIRRSILDEPDGPMLEHGLKGFHGRSIRVPKAPKMQPRPDFLEERYEQFRRVG